MNNFEMEKHEKNFVIEQTDHINDLIQETFKLSQRIKLISYDVSRHYFVFGANNGSIHIYQRGITTTFLKLIPSKNTASIHAVSISPNEENILVTDETGLILILEKCFLEKSFYTHVYPEEKGRIITTIIWENETRVYIGDNLGTVSVVSVPNRMSLPLLNTPYVSLMDLDAPIVQIDLFSRFMLVTTQQKVYICDTSREMYKQVGKKESSKALGGCFYNRFDRQVPESIEDLEKYRIYCAPSSLRVWQANFEGEVLYTHKYKNAIPIIKEIIKLDREEGADLKTENITKPDKKCLKFGRIYMFLSKYLCVVSSQSFYIIDPEKNELIFNFYSLKPVEIRVVDNEIFIWNSAEKLKTLKFTSFEALMCNMKKQKQFKGAAQLVTRYKEDILDWCKYAPNVKLVTHLNLETVIEDNELVGKYNEIVQEIIADEEKRLGEFLKDDDPKITNLSHAVTNICVMNEPNEELHKMFLQYKLNETNSISILPQFTEMLIGMGENDVCQLFFDFIEYMKSIDHKVNMEWCYSQFLNHFHLNKGYLKLNDLEFKTINFVEICFLNLNKDMESGCDCMFPLPCVIKVQPRYEKIGEALLGYREDYKYLLGKIPYLWMHHLRKLKTVKDMEDNLPLILQFGYMNVLQQVSKYVTYDFCDNLVRLFIKLKAKKCLNCSKQFPDNLVNELPNWDYVGFSLIPFIGSNNVLKLFLNYYEHIPKEELTQKFYVSCMYSKVQVNGHKNGGRTVEMASNFFDNSNTKSKFLNNLQSFLMDKLDRKDECTLKKLTCSNCSYCGTLLVHPVLIEVEQLDCGHAFHALCLCYIEKVCNICFSS